MIKEEDCHCGSNGEGNMAKHQAMECADDAQDVANMIEESDNLPEWLEAKITLAADYMNKVKDYLTHHVRGAEPAPSRDDMSLKNIMKSAVTEKAPPGREDQVKALKGKVANPYAVAWSSYNKGKK